MGRVRTMLSATFWLLYGIWYASSAYTGLLWPIGWPITYASNCVLIVVAPCLIVTYALRQNWAFLAMATIFASGPYNLWRIDALRPGTDHEKWLAGFAFDWLFLLAAFGVVMTALEWWLVFRERRQTIAHYDGSSPG